MPYHPQSIFITGTDTGVGKTLVSALLVSAIHHFGYPMGYSKPIQTGEESDCDEVKHWAGLSESQLVRPVYHFPLPMAGLRAARAAGQVIEIPVIVERLQSIPFPCVVEGAGGLLNPLTPTESIRELIAALKLPVLVVSSSQLGTINHTRLTVEALQNAGLIVKGVVLSGSADIGLAACLTELLNTPVLLEIPRLSYLAPAEIRRLAPELFTQTILTQLFD